MYVAIKIIATGSDTTIPQNPPKIPPANTAKIFTNAGNWFVLPYTLGPIIYPSILGHIMQTKIVKINSLVLTTEAIITANIFTIKAPK